MLRNWLSKWRKLLSPTRTEWDAFVNSEEIDYKYEDWALDAERPTLYKDTIKKSKRYDYE